MIKRLKRIKDSILINGYGNLGILKSKNITVNQVQAMDQLRNFVNNGQNQEAALLISQMKDFLDSQHPGAPFYKYEFKINEHGQLSIGHSPAFPGAEKLLPLKGTISFIVPDKYKKFKNMKELLNYSYGMQQEIELDLYNLKTWVGETLLEEISNENGKQLKVTMIPHKFPPPSPMKLYIEDNSWSIDYLLIGVKQMYGSNIIMDNSEQKNAPFNVVFTIELENESAQFNITINDSAIHSVKHILAFKELVLISERYNKPKLALKLLEHDTNLFVAKQWNFNEQEKDRNGFVEFLRKLYQIEQEFNIDFVLPDREIVEWEIHLIELIYTSIQGNFYKYDFKKEFSFTLADHKKIEELLNVSEKYPDGFNLHLDIHNSEPLEVFGIRFGINSHYISIKNAKLANKQKIYRIFGLLDPEDSLEIKLAQREEEPYIYEKLDVSPIVQ